MMQVLVTVQRLFDDYLHYRRHTAHYRRVQEERPYLREPKLNPERRKRLQEMLDFCEENDLDPRWWLYSLFHARQWIAAVRWDHLVPRTNKTKVRALDRYRKLNSAPLLEKSMWKKPMEGPSAVLDVNRDLLVSVENLKRRYREYQLVDRCMDDSRNVTYGFHPKSQVCVECSLAKECESRLRSMFPFDIIALRRGEITSDQALRIAARDRDGR